MDFVIKRAVRWGVAETYSVTLFLSIFLEKSHFQTSKTLEKSHFLVTKVLEKSIERR